MTKREIRIKVVAQGEHRLIRDNQRVRSVLRSFKTLEGARSFAHRILGDDPWVSVNDAADADRTRVLTAIGASMEELLGTAEDCLEGLDPTQQDVISTVLNEDGSYNTVRYDRPSGLVWCDCEQWRSSEATLRVCLHTHQLAEDAQLGREYLLPLEESPQEPASISHTRDRRARVQVDLRAAFKLLRSQGVAACRDLGKVTEEASVVVERHSSWARQHKWSKGVAVVTRRDWKDFGREGLMIRIQGLEEPTQRVLELVVEVLVNNGVHVRRQGEGYLLVVPSEMVA